MHAVKQGLMSILVILCLIALVGCGVSKEEHEKAVSELSKTKAELAQAVTKMADMEKSLSEAQAQLKSQAKEPSPAEKPAEVEKPAAVDTGMQDKLAAAQKEAADLRAKVDSLTGENANLKSMLDKVKADYAEIQKKLGGGGVPGVQTPTPQVPATPAAPQVPAGLPKKP